MACIWKKISYLRKVRKSEKWDLKFRTDIQKRRLKTQKMVIFRGRLLEASPINAGLGMAFWHSLSIATILTALIVIDWYWCQRQFPSWRASPCEVVVLFDWNLSRCLFLGQVVNLDLLLCTKLLNFTQRTWIMERLSQTMSTALFCNIIIFLQNPWKFHFHMIKTMDAITQNLRNLFDLQTELDSWELQHYFLKQACLCLQQMLPIPLASPTSQSYERELPQERCFFWNSYREW